VPCKIGAGGLEKIIEIDMNPAERAALAKSGDAVRESIAQVQL